MASATRRLEKRNDAKRVLRDLLKQPDTLNIIHYSCEGFYDRPQGGSSRIATIGVRHIGSRQTTSFSILQSAEICHVPHEKIVENYDSLEKAMLADFFEYVRMHLHRKWIHWNMLDANYGFKALEHRYRVLGSIPVQIPESNLWNLNSLVSDIYGYFYIEQPRLAKLVELNGISGLNFLSGSEEAQAFSREEFVKLHQSTLKKVDVLHNLIDREWEGTLKTRAGYWQQHGTSLVSMAEVVTKHISFKVLAVIGIVDSIISLLRMARIG